MVSGSDRETVWIMVKAAKVIFGSVKYWAFTLLALQQLSKYLIHISQNDICCFTCFRKYRKTLRAEHMNVSLVTQHGTISGKVSLYLYLYLLTSWFLSRSAFLSNLWFHWYTNEDIYAKIFNTTAAGWQHAPTVKKYNRKSLQVKKYYGLTTEMFSGLLEGLHGAGTAILR